MFCVGSMKTLGVLVYSRHATPKPRPLKWVQNVLGVCLGIRLYIVWTPPYKPHFIGLGVR